MHPYDNSKMTGRLTDRGLIKLNDKFLEFQTQCKVKSKEMTTEVKKYLTDAKISNKQNLEVFKRIEDSLKTKVATITDTQRKEFQELRFKNRCQKKMANLLITMIKDKKKTAEMIEGSANDEILS